MAITLSESTIVIDGGTLSKPTIVIDSGVAAGTATGGTLAAITQTVI